MPDFEDMNETRYREGIYVGYRYFDTFRKKALFPFGFPVQDDSRDECCNSFPEGIAFFLDHLP